MKRFAFIALIMAASSGAAFAHPHNTLSSAAQITLQAIAPDLHTEDLSPEQASRINARVASDNGLSRAQVLTILGQ